MRAVIAFSRAESSRPYRQCTIQVDSLLLSRPIAESARWARSAAAGSRAAETRDGEM